MAKKKAHTKKRKQRKPVRRSRPKAKNRRTRPVAKKRRKRSVGAKKKAPVKRRRKRSQGRKLVKQVEKRSVERVMAGKRKRRRRHRPRRVRMAGSAPRRRTVGKSGSSGLLLGLAIGAGALYLLSKTGSPSSQYVGPGSPYEMPPLSQTGNYTRDTQSQQIVNYALAAGLTLNAITKLIESLNASSDSTVNNVYDKVNTTGQLTNLGLPGYDAIV